MDTMNQKTMRPDNTIPDKPWEELFGTKRGERTARSTRARRKRKENRYAKEKRLFGK
jgi:hypothetical protein